MKTTNTPPAHRQGEDGDRRAEDERRVVFALNPDDTIDGKESEESATESIREVFAAHITTYRKKLKLSRAALADKVGVTEAAIGQYERGIRTPQIEILCKFADLFNVSVDELVGHSSENYNAVEQYRYERAADLVFDYGFFVFETESGSVKICSQTGKERPTFQKEDGVVSTRQAKGRYTTRIEFFDRKSFIAFIEYFVHFLACGNHSKIFSDYIDATACEQDYFPDLRIQYLGNAMISTGLDI